MSVSTPQRRYEVNSYGLYDCPDESCERRGQNGFAHAKQAGTHARWSHNIAGGRKLAARPPLGDPLLCAECGTRYTTAAAAARHRSMAHGIRGRNWKYSKAGKAAAAAGTQPQRLPAPIAQAQAEDPGNHVNHCPRCGLNIGIVRAAMAQAMQELDPAQAVQVLAIVRQVSERLV